MRKTELWRSPAVSITGGFQDPIKALSKQSSDLNLFEKEAGVEASCNPSKSGLSYDNRSSITVKVSKPLSFSLWKITTKSIFQKIITRHFPPQVILFCLSATAQQGSSKK